MSSAEAVPALSRCLIRLSTRVALAQVLARDPQPVLRRQHLEIGIGGGDHGGQADHLAVVAAGDRGFLGRAQGGAVLAPEVDFVAGASARPTGCRARSRRTSRRRRRALRGARMRWRCRRGRHRAAAARRRCAPARRPARCGRPRRRYRDWRRAPASMMSVNSLRAEAAPPVERRQRRFRQRRIARAAVIGLRNVEPGLGLVAGEQAAAERQHQAESLQHGHD